MKQALWLFPLIVLVGCSSTVTPKYTVGLEKMEPVEMPCGGLTVRMASDLRSYSHPLRFKADGTVEQVRSLTYYAPLEVVLERALRDVSSFNPASKQVKQVIVETFAVVEGEDGEFVRVRLRGYPGNRVVRVDTSTVDTTDVAALRAALAEALYRAFVGLEIVGSDLNVSAGDAPETQSAEE